MAGDAPSFDPREISLRDARRLAIVLSELGRDPAPIGGGWMAADPPGSWANRASAVGVAGPVDEVTLDRLEAYFLERGRRPRIQLSPYEDPGLLAAVADRGYVLRQMDSVLLHDLAPDGPGETVPGLRFRPVDPADAGSVAAFCASQAVGFLEGTDPDDAFVEITERVARSPRCRLWLLELGGRVVGSGGLEPFEGSAVMICGCIHPEARRLGLQSAFMRFRLEQARDAGHRHVLIGSDPGATTERNALRSGFVPCHTALLLELPEPGAGVE